MAVSAQIQAALDGIRQTQSLLKSVEDGLAVQKQMIADQANQIAALQAQISAGGAPLSADDIAALAETNADIASVNTSLQADIPANTQPANPNVVTSAIPTPSVAPPADMTAADPGTPAA